MSQGPIKIVRIMDRLNVGGPALHAAVTSAGLSPKKTGGAFETVLVHGAPAPGEEEMNRALETHGGFRRVFIPSLSRAVSPFKDLRAFFSILSVLRREKPKVVHTHKSKAGVLGRIAAWLLGIPVRVHTFHGQVFEGYFSGASSKLIVWTERLLAKISGAVLAVSPLLARELETRYRIAPASKIRVLPLGLELGPLASPQESRRLQRELGLAPKTPAVGIVGRLVPIKNHSLFLSAARALAETDPKVNFFVIGAGECGEALKEEALRLGLKGRCHFTGNRSDMAEVYASLDVVALTSENEGTPVTLIEALAAGVPVIASDAGGVRDVLEGGRLGTLFARGNEAALARGLSGLLQNPPPGEARERARRSVLARYSAGRLCDDLAALYRELLSRPG